MLNLFDESIINLFKILNYVTTEYLKTEYLQKCVNLNLIKFLTNSTFSQISDGADYHMTIIHFRKLIK